MKRILLTIVLLCGYAAAQCPVQVTKAFTRGVYRESGGRLSFPSMVIHFTNVSDKVIVGTKFSAYYTNAVGDKRESVNTFTTGDTVKPGKSKRVEFNQYDTNSIKAPSVYVLKVKFQDGTTWEDDGKRSCIWERH